MKILPNIFFKEILKMAVSTAEKFAQNIFKIYFMRFNFVKLIEV